MITKEVRAEVLERAGNCCERCRKRPGEFRGKLNFHHLQYTLNRQGKSPDESAKGFRLLCPKCHGKQHTEDLHVNPAKCWCTSCGHRWWSPSRNGCACPRCPRGRVVSFRPLFEPGVMFTLEGTPEEIALWEQAAKLVGVPLGTFVLTEANAKADRLLSRKAKS